MAAWIWILIAIGVVVVLGLIVFGAMRGREKAQRREKAQELRQQASTHTQQAKDQERVVEPQPAARVNTHRTHVLPNTRSVARGERGTNA